MTAADAAIKAAEDLPMIYCSFDLSELLAIQSHHGESSGWPRACRRAAPGGGPSWPLRIAGRRGGRHLQGHGRQALAARMHMLAATTAINGSLTKGARGARRAALVFHEKVGVSLYAEQAAVLPR